jgi:hypothetical protein
MQRFFLVIAKNFNSLAYHLNVNQMKQQALEVFKIFERNFGEMSAKKIVDHIENPGTMERVVKENISEAKADLIKWMFVFWVSQLIAVFSFLMLFLKK